jgi:REP element-mobilizing transposase RayT
MPHPWKKTPFRDMRTLGGSRAVRWDRCDYCGDETIHLILRTEVDNLPSTPGVCQNICESVEFYCRKFHYQLFGYCLMPDHLHVLLSPNSTGTVIADWLQAFKSYTSHFFAKQGGSPPLWQRSAFDHVCRDGETAENVLRYILENPVRKELVTDLRDWKWSKTFIEI